MAKQLVKMRLEIYHHAYAYLAGLEWTNTKIKYPTTVSIEAIDHSHRYNNTWKLWPKYNV